ncbi:IclR helix-turn-helix domain-containing protein [Halogranum rubrum]|uniref:IclR helix-turn-helix domain-containing protein n=1 Tax=Halogranum rubrum TaxID=553466 RepID=A0A1I4IIK3_9EURY|nr:helix-turn-helix domain-containing protein [Halogranum rubrum]SFL53606.1 IclR helix-turn-helix domain-containing protein [Halogranum rubrum]
MQTRTRAAVVAALVLTVSLVAIPVGAVTAQLGAVTVEGDAVVQTDANETYLWQSESFTVNTSFATDTGGVYQFCLEGNNDGNKSQRLTCQSQTIKNNTTTSISFRVKNASGLNGEVSLSVLATESFNSNSMPVNRSKTVYVIQKQGDFDGDRLSNQAEVRAGTDINGTDTDGDTLRDGDEVQIYNTSPTKSDTDGDGLSDSTEVGSSARSNATVADTDGDGLLDGKEVELGTNPAVADTDGDGLSDGEEVHTYDTDPTEVDTDGDGIPDDEEIMVGTTPNDGEADSDNDGVPDNEEAEAGTNASLADSDGDFLSDKTELELGTDPTDGTTLLVLLAGIGFLVIGLVGCIRLFGPDDPADLSAWLPSGGAASGSSTPSDVATNGGSAMTTDSTSPADSADTPTPVGEETGDPDDPMHNLPFDLSDPLTDEDEVLKLLYESEGRLRQSEINNATDWSKSKVSRLLSSMEEDGKIRKITIGRENLVTLADRVPESAESPFEDEAK